MSAASAMSKAPAKRPTGGLSLHKEAFPAGSANAKGQITHITAVALSDSQTEPRQTPHQEAVALGLISTSGGKKL